MSDKTTDSIHVEITLGEVIAIYRDSRRMTQAELAKKVGVSRNYISTIERGRHIDRVSWGLIKRIVKEIGFKIQIVADNNHD